MTTDTAATATATSCSCPEQHRLACEFNPEFNPEFITTIVIGDEHRDSAENVNYLPLCINPWTNKVEDQDGDVVAPLQSRDGKGTGWTTEKGALNYARGLQSIRWPGEDIFLIVNRVFPEGDGPADLTYFVAGPMSCDTFAEYQEA